MSDESCYVCQVWNSGANIAKIFLIPKFTLIFGIRGVFRLIAYTVISIRIPSKPLMQLS